MSKTLKLRLKSGFTFFAGLLLLLVCEAGGLSFLHGLLELLAVEVDFLLHAVDGFFQNSFLQLALPDDDDVPAFGFQLAPDFLVTLLVARDLGCPEGGVGLWNGVLAATLVTVPETAVHEYNSTVFWKDNIRFSWEALFIYQVTETIAP